MSQSKKMTMGRPVRQVVEMHRDVEAFCRTHNLPPQVKLWIGRSITLQLWQVVEEDAQECREQTSS